MSNSSVEDVGNRFAAIDADHQGGVLWIAASLMLAYFLMSCILRIVIFYPQFTRDTICLVVGTVFGFIQVMVVYAELSAGYGTSIDLLSPHALLAIQKDGYIADIIFIIAIALSKLAMVWFVSRLTPDPTHSKLSMVAAGLCVAWGLGSLLSLALKCDLAQPWITIGEKCSNIVLRWQLITAFDVLTEVIILALIIALVFNLHMPSKKKATVVLGFLFRIPLIVLAIVHVHYVQSFSASTNPTFDQITPSVIMSVQMGWALISATIPCLRAFVANLGSGYLGAGLNANLGQFSLSGGRSTVRRDPQDESYVLNKINVSRAQETEIVGGREQHHGQKDSASVRSANRVSNDGSQEFIIRKTVDYQVSYKDSEVSQQYKGQDRRVV